jgi:hypothetical protein
MTLRLEDLQLRLPLFQNFSFCLELFKVFILLPVLPASAKQEFTFGLSIQCFATGLCSHQFLPVKVGFSPNVFFFFQLIRGLE